MNIPQDLHRLALPYSRVTIFNSSEVQTHVVIDRFSQGHTLRPGSASTTSSCPTTRSPIFRSTAALTGSSPPPIPPSPACRSRCIQ